MIRKTDILALGLSAAAGVAPAHTGATGVVLERMNGMTGMRDIMRQLAPMMQGAAPYDALSVSEGGYVIASHAGETMRGLFPEGSIQGVTYAKPEIWTDWQDFAAMADELRVYAEALSDAAINGLEPATAVIASDTGAANFVAVSPDPVPAPDRTQQIAQLMGYGSPARVVLPVPSGGAGTKPAVDLAGLAADDLFQRISGTCSACHARFRAGRS